MARKLCSKQAVRGGRLELQWHRSRFVVTREANSLKLHACSFCLFAHGPGAAEPASQVVERASELVLVSSYSAADTVRAGARFEVTLAINPPQR